MCSCVNKLQEDPLSGVQDAAFRGAGEEGGPEEDLGMLRSWAATGQVPALRDQGLLHGGGLAQEAEPGYQ